MGLTGLDDAFLRNEGEDKLPADTLEGWLEDCRTVPALPIAAGQLARLMIMDSQEAELNTVLANLDNDFLTPAQKVALFHVYNEIAALFRASLEALSDLDESDRNIAFNEVLRSLFKGEIDLKKMTPEGFQTEIRRYVTNLRSKSSLHE